MRLSPRYALLSCLFLAAAPDRVLAQFSSFEGGSFERDLGLGGQPVAFTYRRTEVSRGGLGLDLGVGIFPAALAARAVLLQFDAGFAQALAIGPATLVLKTGVGSLVNLGQSVQVIPGLQAGVAAIIPLERRCGLRLDLTRRQIYPQSGSIGLWSIGFGFTVMIRSRPVSDR
jgi:hypothetical protein